MARILANWQCCLPLKLWRVPPSKGFSSHGQNPPGKHSQSGRTLASHNCGDPFLPAEDLCRRASHHRESSHSIPSSDRLPCTPRPDNTEIWQFLIITPSSYIYPRIPPILAYHYSSFLLFISLPFLPHDFASSVPPSAAGPLLHAH
jgi:hypothetical protein